METDPIRQIAIFRVPELQACLTQLRLSRTGLKRDLQTRLGTHLRVLIASAELSADPFTRKKKDDAGLLQLHEELKKRLLVWHG